MIADFETFVTWMYVVVDFTTVQKYELVGEGKSGKRTEGNWYGTRAIKKPIKQAKAELKQTEVAAVSTVQLSNQLVRTCL